MVQIRSVLTADASDYRDRNDEIDANISPKAAAFRTHIKKHLVLLREAIDANDIEIVEDQLLVEPEGLGRHPLSHATHAF